MKKMFLLPVFFISFGSLSAIADTTYTTINGAVNLVAGLSNVIMSSALNSTNQASGISYITDTSWSDTGIANLGGVGSGAPNNGILAGFFGGGTYFNASSKVILIGVYGGSSPAWGSWRVRLFLSDGNLSAPLDFTDADLILNPSIQTSSNPSFFENLNGSTLLPGQVSTTYQELNIGAFDTGNIGIQGIELSNLTIGYPDLTYIGVTGVPEPSALSLLAVGLGGLAMLRRRCG